MLEKSFCFFLLHVGLGIFSFGVGRFAAAKTTANNVPQYDCVISNFGTPLRDWFYAVDYFLFLSIMLLLPFASLELYCKFVFEHAILIVARGLSICATVGYVSFRKFETHPDTPPSLIRSGGNSDLTVSGHTMVQTLILCFIHDVAPLWYFYGTSFIVFTGLAIIVLSGEHYTSDVILGSVLAFFVHY